MNDFLKKEQYHMKILYGICSFFYLVLLSYHMHNLKV